MGAMWREIAPSETQKCLSACRLFPVRAQVATLQKAAAAAAEWSVLLRQTAEPSELREGHKTPLRNLWQAQINQPSASWPQSPSPPRSSRSDRQRSRLQGLCTTLNALSIMLSRRGGENIIKFKDDSVSNDLSLHSAFQLTVTSLDYFMAVFFYYKLKLRTIILAKGFSEKFGNF